MFLGLANLLHHKVRGMLSAMAVGIGVAMLVTLLGLSHGSLDEITHRMAAVNADLLITPLDWNSVMSSAPFSEAHVAKALAVKIDGRPVAARVAPVFREMMVVNRVEANPNPAKKSKQMQTVYGIRSADWDLFLSPSQSLVGRGFRDEPGMEKKLFSLLQKFPDPQAATTQMDAAEQAVLAEAHELVIDQRLASFGHIAVGDEVEGWDQRFKVVGIAPTGVTVRVFASLPTVRFVKEQPGGASFLFVKLAPDVDLAAARKALAAGVGGSVLTLQEFGNVLSETWALIPQFTLAVSIITLVVAFLFVLVIMYTVVIQRTREIGILKALGASKKFIVWTVVSESMMLSLAGTAFGLALSFAGKAAILHFMPLLTVDLKAAYVLAGAATGLLGGLISGLYPALVAAGQDPVTALSFE